MNQENSELLSREEATALKLFSPNNPPWNNWAAFGLWAFSVLMIIIMPAIFIAPYLFTYFKNFSDQQALAKFVTTDVMAILIQLAAIIPAHLLTLVLAWFIITQRGKYPFKEMLGWDWGGYSPLQISLAFIGLLFSVFLVAAVTTNLFGEQDNDFLKMLRSSRYVVFLVAIIATFSAPIVEEVVYRGVLYSALQKVVNIPTAVFLITFIFAVVHFPQYWGSHATLITLTFLSLVITLIRVKTNSLLPCIVFHFLINGIQSILLVLQPYLPNSLHLTNEAKAFFF